MTYGPPPVIGWAVAVAVLLLGCSAGDSCAATRADPDCADLRFGGRLYDEWREVSASTARQEVGNATYPACNAEEGCPGSEFDGFGATDVWLVGDVAIEDAVIGIREGTDTYVVFVRRGVDPASLRASERGLRSAPVSPGSPSEGDDDADAAGDSRDMTRRSVDGATHVDSRS